MGCLPALCCLVVGGLCSLIIGCLGTAVVSVLALTIVPFYRILLPPRMLEAGHGNWVVSSFQL